MARERLPIDPREAMALAEMAATRVAPGLARTMIAVFLAAIAIVPVIQIVREVSESGGPLSLIPQAPPAIIEAFTQARLDGVGIGRSTTRANREAQRQIGLLEDAIEDETWLSERLRGSVQLVLTGVFGVGNQQTHVARDGWLFYSPDVHYVTGRGFLEPRQMTKRIEDAPAWEEPPQPDPRAAILDFKRQLDARGITLVVMPVPGKTTIHPERLSRRYTGQEPPLQNRSYASFLSDLEAAGVIVFDAARVIAPLRTQGSGVYLTTDTHWRPEVVRAVAERLSAVLVERAGLEPAVPPFSIESESVANTGDLAVLLDLPPDAGLFPPEPVTISRVLDQAGTGWRPTPGAQVVLLGDSFTNIYALASMGWGHAAGLAEHLSAALGRPIDRIVQNDQGAHATRELLARQLAERPDRLNGVRVIVYQFATRELSVGDWKIVELGGS